MIYRGYHIVLWAGRYSVYSILDATHGYLDKKGEFNNRAAAEKLVRELIRVKP